MKNMRSARHMALSLAAFLIPSVLAAKTTAPPTAPAQTTASPQTAPETHPLGDIPDSQAFVRFTSAAGGYSLEVPEGWSRRTSVSGVTFTSKLNQVDVQTVRGSAAPTVASVRSGVLATLGRANPGVKVTVLKAVRLPAGPAVLARFTSAGAANEVTGRRETLENDLYVFGKGGRQLVLRLSAPFGSDNVDAWNTVARSLVWK
ncbi:hypothetical protein Q0M94_22415 (plasmid) [Deinococcus radiomollis]|uniref:hypothetical protein n=1 Tax=Deinococcus radiomollis TaxID=468916 RepID=UPI00389158E5